VQAYKHPPMHSRRLCQRRGDEEAEGEEAEEQEEQEDDEGHQNTCWYVHHRAQHEDRCRDNAVQLPQWCGQDARHGRPKYNRRQCEVSRVYQRPHPLPPGSFRRRVDRPVVQDPLFVVRYSQQRQRKQQQGQHPK
jgi:hypothetical protein